METDIAKDEPVSTAVIRAVSAVTGRKSDSLQPLTDVIDPEALDMLFAPRPDGTLRNGGWLSFSYSRCRITIHNGDFLTIEPVQTTGRQAVHPDGAPQPARSHPNRGTQQTALKRTTGSGVCFVCQQPIQGAKLQRERGTLVHPNCQPERRCGISFQSGLR